MRFSLLTPPTESPRTIPQIPLPQNWPGEGHLAVDTRAIPRQLPAMPDLGLVAMDPAASSAPFAALARAGAAGAGLGMDTLNLVLQAEARKKEADDLAEATGLYTQTAIEVEDRIEKLKTSTDHTTFRPGFDAMWKEVAGKNLEQAKSPQVQRALGLKLAAFRVSKIAEVSNVSRQKFVDYHESTLSENSKALTLQATAPDATPPDRDLAIANLKSLYVGYARTGILPPDKLEALQSKYLTNTFNILAHQALAKDPEAFLPKSEENPGGQDGYQAFTATGKYPADPKYVNSLLDTVAPRMVETKRREARLADERRETNFNEQMKGAHQQKFDQLVEALDSGEPDRVTAASATVDQAIRDSGLYWTDGQKAALRNLGRTVRVQGGVTNDRVYNDLMTKIINEPGSVTGDQILDQVTQRQLAVTGERSAQSLKEKIAQLKKPDDTSQRPDYAVGKSLLTAALGGGNTLSAAAVYSPQSKITDVAKHGDLYSKALEEFDRRARTAGWADKDLRELGAEIRDAYMRMLYPDYTPPAGSSRGKPTPKGTP